MSRLGEILTSSSHCLYSLVVINLKKRASFTRVQMFICHVHNRSSRWCTPTTLLHIIKKKHAVERIQDMDIKHKMVQNVILDE